MRPSSPPQPLQQARDLGSGHARAVERLSESDSDGSLVLTDGCIEVSLHVRVARQWIVVAQAAVQFDNEPELEVLMIPEATPPDRGRHLPAW
ncbi:hypothetical protein [Gordonia spumicola]|uniref:hypothetical protein n=1 Tax=Gordonia spumicola TaxID=589161 RepID=UPI00137B8E41|nr:hypothetical protein [Gordonia spumicola]